jgi:glycosyltransferase involved in cell wall biosynthesis
MAKVRISAVIMTYNEEKRIRACLQSVADVVDEILVVDSFSTDTTVQICEEFDARVIQNAFPGYVQQRAFGLKHASNKYVLQIDADEVLSEGLIKALLRVKNNWTSDAYYVNRLTNYAGKWIKHCGWYPDRRIRLFDKERIVVAGKNPHDRVDVAEGFTASSIKEDILHYSYTSISNHVEKTNAFSDIEAKSAFERGEKSTIFWHILIKPSYLFFDQYFLKRGFLDGYYGLVICIISAFGKFLRYVKLRDYNKEWK